MFVIYYVCYLWYLTSKIKFKLKYLVMRNRDPSFDIDSLCDTDIEYIDISNSEFEEIEKLVEKYENIIELNKTVMKTANLILKKIVNVKI